MLELFTGVATFLTAVFLGYACYIIGYTRATRVWQDIFTRYKNAIQEDTKDPYMLWQITDPQVHCSQDNKQRRTP